MTEDDERRRLSAAERDESTAEVGKTLLQEFELDHPPGKVWAALTEGRLLSRWLLPCELAPRGEGRLGPGASFSFQMPEDEGGEGRVDCEVVELELGRRLGLAWRTHADRDPRPADAVDALVTFEVEPLPQGRTRLRIRQTGLPALPRGAAVMLRRARLGPRSRPVSAVLTVRPPAIGALPLAA